MGKGFNGESCAPSGEVGVDGPTSVGANGGANETGASQGDECVAVSRMAEAHEHKTREWSGFQEAAIWGLDGFEDGERALAKG